MSRTVRLGLGLLAILLLLGGYFYLKNRPAGEEEDRPVTTRIPLIEKDAADLTSITTNPLNGDGYRLLRQGDQWTIDVPWRDEIDPRRLARIASDAVMLTADRQIDTETADLSTFGLEPPVARAELEFEDGERVLLDIGSETPSGTKRYLKIDGGENIYTVSSFYLNNLLADPREFRIASVPTIDSRKFRYLRIESADETIELVPFETVKEVPAGSILSGLAMVQPIGPRGVDTTALDELLKGLPPAFTIADFVDDAPASLAPYGLDSPAYKVTMRDEERTFSFSVGNQDSNGNYFVSFEGDPRVLAIPASDLSILSTDSFTLTEKFVLIINIDDVDSFEVFRGETHYTARIERTGEGDELEERYFLEDQEIEEDDFKGLYQDLIGIVADAPNRGESDSGDPELIIQYHLNKGPVEQAEASFVPVDRDFYAAYRHGESLFLVSSQQIRQVFDTIDSLLTE